MFTLQLILQQTFLCSYKRDNEHVMTLEDLNLIYEKTYELKGHYVNQF